jgi:hypothetical protein
MAEKVRLNVTLDAEIFAKLSTMAARTHLQEGTLARSLLSRAIDAAEPDGEEVTELLDRVDGAFESAKRGLRDIDRNRTVSIDRLR